MCNALMADRERGVVTFTVADLYTCLAKRLCFCLQTMNTFVHSLTASYVRII